MASSHLLGLLACLLLLLAAHHASASPSKRSYRNPIVQDTCPVTVQVGEEFQLAHVPLEGSRMFELNPNQPEMSVRLQGDDLLYKASVDGTMIKLLGCDALETNCTMLQEGGTKSSDFLKVDRWNGVEVKYSGGQVTVDVNMVNVMSQEMPPMKKDASKGISSGGYVAFTVPPSSPSYNATLKIFCDDDGHPPAIISTEPPTSPAPPTVTRTLGSSSLDERPFPACPPLRVESNYPTNTKSSPVLESFTYAIYPNHPAINLDVFIGELNIKIQLKGSRAELRKCQTVGSPCSLEDTTNSTQDVLDEERWNIVNVYLESGKLVVKVNNIVLLMGPLELHAPKRFTLVVAAPQDTKTWGTVPFTAYVNNKCGGSEQPTVPPGHGHTSTSTMHPSTGSTPTQGGFVTGHPPTHDGFVTKDATGETATPAHASGISRDVSIVVGVLLGVVLVIAIAIAIFRYRKRRSVTINQHPPLPETQQQQ